MKPLCSRAPFRVAERSWPVQPAAGNKHWQLSSQWPPNGRPLFIPEHEGLRPGLRRTDRAGSDRAISRAHLNRAPQKSCATFFAVGSAREVFYGCMGRQMHFFIKGRTSGPSLGGSVSLPHDSYSRVGAVSVLKRCATSPVASFKSTTVRQTKE